MILNDKSVKIAGITYIILKFTCKVNPCKEIAANRPRKGWFYGIKLNLTLQLKRSVKEVPMLQQISFEKILNSNDITHYI